MAYTYCGMSSYVTIKNIPRSDNKWNIRDAET